MQTSDPLENLTEYSDAVEVTVRDRDGIRVFYLEKAKVVLRYRTVSGIYDNYAYHPSNIASNSSFRPGSGDRLELVVMTEELITLIKED